jgi:Family of unknown function (DUF6051)
LNYVEEYKILRKVFTENHKFINISELGININKLHFTSDTKGLFRKDHFEKQIDSFFVALFKYYLSKNPLTDKYFFNSLDATDDSIQENKQFQYLLVQREDEIRSQKLIILFHGLNERSWIKYLPWAAELCKTTGKAVLLFPIAFHMDRAPVSWSNPRLMQEVARERRLLFPGIIENSFANTAISIRLQYSPRRFLISGLQTYNDVVALVKMIKENRYSLIDKNASIDFFGYSIGGFLGEMLMMINPQNHFGNSRLFIFCGGPTFDLMTPLSKAIIDSEANSAIRSYFTTNFAENIFCDEILADYFKNHKKEMDYLISFLRFENNQSLREKRLIELKDQLSIVALVNDRIIPAESISKTFHKIKDKVSRIKYLNFNHNYSHVNPFPIFEKHKKEIDYSFKETFRLASAFYI